MKGSFGLITEGCLILGWNDVWSRSPWFTPILSNCETSVRLDTWCLGTKLLTSFFHYLKLFSYFRSGESFKNWFERVVNDRKSLPMNSSYFCHSSGSIPAQQQFPIPTLWALRLDWSKPNGRECTVHPPVKICGRSVSACGFTSIKKDSNCGNELQK